MYTVKSPSKSELNKFLYGMATHDISLVNRLHATWRLYKNKYIKVFNCLVLILIHF